MTAILTIKNGVIKTIYSDDVFPGLSDMGKVVIKRATHVEFDNDANMWIGTTADLGKDNMTKPGTVIARAPTRKGAIDQEIDFLNKNM